MAFILGRRESPTQVRTPAPLLIVIHYVRIPVLLIYKINEPYASIAALFIYILF